MLSFICLCKTRRLVHPNGFHACQLNHLCVEVTALLAWIDFAVRYVCTGIYLFVAYTIWVQPSWKLKTILMTNLMYFSHWFQQRQILFYVYPGIFCFITWDKPVLLSHGASLSFWACCDYSWHPTSETLALEALTMSQIRPTVLICYGTEFLIKSRPFILKVAWWHQRSING